MGNTVTSPPTLPDPDAVLPGVIVRAATWDRSANLANRAAASQVGGLVISQSWPAGTVQHTGDTEQQVTPAGWAVPLISPLHGTLDCYVEASSAGGGTVRLHAVEEDDDALFDVPDGGATVIGPVELVLKDDGSGGDVVTMHLVADGVADTVTVLAVWAVAQNPAVLTRAADATPFGRLYTAADRPLSAARGRQLASSLQAAIDRVRPMVSWAAIDDVDGAGVPRMPDHGIEAVALYHGDRPAGAYTGRIHAHADELDGAELVIDGEAVATVEADDLAAWITLADAHSRLDGAFVAGDGTLSFRPISLVDADDLDPPAPSDVIVAGFAFWGP